MTNDQLEALREQRAAAYTEMREVLDGAGDSALSAEDSQKYDRAETEFDKLDATIQRAERAATRARSDAAVAGRTDDPERDAAQRGENREQRFAAAIETAQRTQANLVSFLGSDEYREAFLEGAMRRGLLGAEMPAEYRAALNLGVDAEGGYTAPVDFVAELFVEAADVSDIRNYAKVISTVHGRDLEYPTLATKGSASWTDEVPADPDALKSEPTFGAPKTLKAYPFQRECVTSKDLLQDSRLDIAALIRSLIIESGEELESAAFITGNGSNKPTGLVTGLDAGNVITGAGGQTTTVTADDLIDVQHSIKPRYRANARWRMNDSSVKAIRKLVDGNGQYIWRPGLSQSEPALILGAPYSVDAEMADMAANATPITFGDESGYWIRDVLALTITRLVETYARSRQVGFLADGRVDGKLMRPERIAAYKNAAA